MSSTSTEQKSPGRVTFEKTIDRLMSREGFRGSWNDAARQLREEDESWGVHRMRGA